MEGDKQGDKQGDILTGRPSVLELPTLEKHV